SNVPDNIICPGDSILLTSVQAGVSYNWVGPQGNSIGTNQTIWVNVPGFYHCVLTDFDGCILTSNTIELLEYNTPFLIADPGTELCHSGAIQLTAIYSGLPSFQWLPPINSTNPSIVVNQPGTYYLEVTQCGFTVTDSITITQSNVISTITLLTDTIICPGDSAILVANSGMASYEWGPLQFFGQTIQITDTGDYYVTVTEGSAGCSAVSDTIHISFHPGGSIPNVQNHIICYGDSILLTNLNIGLTTDWFTDSTTSTPFFTGDNLVFNNVTNDTIIYVENYDPNCTSIRIPVSISISRASITPIIIGNNNICFGDSIILSATNITNGSYNWNGPNGFISSQNPLIISNSDTLNAGIYTLSISDNLCVSEDTSITVSILPLPTISINTPDTIWKCFADTISISASGNYQSILWNTGLTLDSTNAFIAGQYHAFATGINGCNAISNTVYVINYQTQNPIFSDTTICFGDSLLLSSLNGLTLNWYDTTFSLITIDSVYQTPPLYNSTYYGATFTDNNNCESQPQFISIFIAPTGTPNIIGDTIICEGQSLSLSTSNFPGGSYQWSNSFGT
ncbi:MAG: hypothetical protein HRT73_16120, partial [Flavobacteriales bacterium]|nr:hypothetical protein [Flavobacteriales bacterium]